MATTMHCAPYLADAVADHLRVGHRGRVEAHLVGAGIEQAPHVGDVRTPPPTVSGMKTCEATASMIVQDQVAAVAGRRDVEEGELVGALLVVARGDLDRIAGVAQLDEVDALDDAAGR